MTKQTCGPKWCKADSLREWGKCTCGYPIRPELQKPDVGDNPYK